MNKSLVGKAAIGLMASGLLILVALIVTLAWGAGPLVGAYVCGVFMMAGGFALRVWAARQ